MTKDAAESDLGRMLATYDASMAVIDEGNKHRMAMKSLFLDLFQVIDGLLDIEHEAAQSPENKPVAALAKSTGIVLKRLNRLLAERGVLPIDTTGHQLDLQRHRVVETRVTAEYSEQIVLEEKRKGYVWDSQVLRPADVVVSKLTDTDDATV